MNERIIKLQEFVKYKHGKQVRKYTGEPYYNHVFNVSQIAKDYVEFGEEIGLCHDLFEDTDCTKNELANFLLSIGYNANETHGICFSVEELTDMYTSEAFPKDNREQRKRHERARLSNISIVSQTVKYADIIDNCSTIFKYDPNFSKIYLREKQELLSVMDNGNKDLWNIAYDIIF